MLLVVLNDWVIETNEVPAFSNASTSLAKSNSERQAIDLVDDDDVDLAGGDIGQQPLERRALQRAAGDAAIVVEVGKRGPAFAGLAQDIGGTGLALGVEAVEALLQPFVRDFRV
jgi:hypothetical protein